MAMTMKQVADGVIGVGKALTVENTVAGGGGLSALLVRRKMTGTGAALVFGGMGAFNLANEGLKGHNRASLGKVSASYMHSTIAPHGTGAGQAIRRISGGNPVAFSELADDVVASPGIMGKIDDYGANSALISALYNMGGR